MLRAQLEREIRKVRSGLVHDVKFVVSPASLGSSAAALNAAGAGTFKKQFRVHVQNAEGLILDYFNNFDLDVAGAGTFASLTPPTNPTITSGTVSVKHGIATVEAVYSTGSGKVYTVGDTIAFTFKAKTGTILADFAPAQIVVTDTIVA